MTKDEALKMALSALETVRPYEVVDYIPLEEAITALRQAIEQQEQDWSIEEAALASLREHMREIKQLRAALEQAGHIPDATKMMQEPDVYGDGNVYRGQRSKDSTTKTLHYTAQPEAENQEPVAWMSPNKERLEFSRKDTVYGSHTIPLYTTPPKREWVGLTDEEIDDIAAESGFGYINVARAIEAKLKEKNT